MGEYSRQDLTQTPFSNSCKSEAQRWGGSLGPASICLRFFWVTDSRIKSQRPVGVSRCSLEAKLGWYFIIVPCRVAVTSGHVRSNRRPFWRRELRRPKSRGVREIKGVW